MDTTYNCLFLCLFVLFVFLSAGVHGEVLNVGPDRTYERIERAYKNASPGDTIRVHPKNDNAPYRKVAVNVTKKNITFRAVPYREKHRVPINGEGFNYSGRMPIPRAIFQFNPQADGGVIEGFKLYGASNNSHNGAGVRINQANHVTIRDCEITGNDMGIMSGGRDLGATGVNQRIVGCRIHHNGTAEDPGYNHNLYLGGTSVTITACEIYASTTGHNVKSRAHYTRVQYSYVHDSANREFDLVQRKGVTDAPGSHAVLLGSVIEKKRNMNGNKAVIHYGTESNVDHLGTLSLTNNTVVTPYRSPVMELSAPGASARAVNNIFWNGGVEREKQSLVRTRNGAKAENVSGTRNWFSRGWRHDLKRFGTQFKNAYVADAGEHPPFKAPGNGHYHLNQSTGSLVDRGTAWTKLDLPPVPGARKADRAYRKTFYQYTPELKLKKRETDGSPDLGAFEY